MEIETKFLEAEGALDEISFGWEFAWGNPTTQFDPNTGDVLHITRRVITSYSQKFTGNTRTLSAAHSPTGTTRDTIISIPDNEDVSMNLANPLPTCQENFGLVLGFLLSLPLIHLLRSGRMDR